MWKNFAKALEKRVKKNSQKGFLPDRFMIIKTVEEYLLKEYGKEGSRNVEVFLSKREDYLILRCQKSIWRSEIKLNEKKIINSVNSRFDGRVIKGCFLK
jgi:hypothetical protein